MVKSVFRLHASESVQFFQFNSSGNMYVYPPGAGYTGEPKFVHPGEEFVFSGESEIHEDSQVLDSAMFSGMSSKSDENCGVGSTQWYFNAPLQQD